MMKPRHVCILLAGALLFLSQPLHAAPQLAGAMAGLSADGSAVELVRDRTYRRNERQQNPRRTRRQFERPDYPPHYYGYGWDARRDYQPQFGSYQWWDANDWFRTH